MPAAAADRLVAMLGTEIADRRVLDAIAAIPREQFVPPALVDRAYENVALPIGRGQTISQPLVVARMAELLELEPTDVVLDVGTGSGYHAAVLGRLGADVWTIERHEELAATARAALMEAGVANVHCLVGDGSAGVPERGPYDAINVAAATGRRGVRALAAGLAPGGRIVAPVRAGLTMQRLVRGHLPADGGPVSWEAFEPVRFVPLIAGAGRS